MKVLIVINNLYSKGNGLCGAVRDNIAELKKRKIEVKVLSGANHFGDEQPDFMLKDFKIPIFNKFVLSYGYCFSKADKKVIRDAIKWADIIHIEEPFYVQVIATKIAKKMNVPCVASYHLYPENIFASIKMGKSRALNDMLMLIWRNLVYNRCKIIHCPTKNVEDRLRKWKFKSELRCFSNGLNFNKLLHVNKEYKKNDVYNIISIGRLSNEKDLKTIIKSLKYSKYKDRIKLTLAGKGPLEKKLIKYANKLYKKNIIKEKVEFGFFDIEHLQKLAENADLYIHAAHIEVEGLSCLEAIQTGLVPIISEGKYTATSQFALSDNSKFKAGNAKDLANKIDYWLSDDKNRYNESLKYKRLSYNYDINHSIDEMIKMYNDALAM